MIASSSPILLDINAWWSAMGTLEQVYWGVAMLSTLFFIIILILTFIGGDGDFSTDPDIEVEMDTGAGFQFFTFKNLIGFMTLFGWSGLACIELGASFPMTLIISIFCGLAMMTLMAWMFFFMSRMVDSGTLKLANAINGLGEVYLPIPAKRGGLGKIQIKVQGSLRELDAMTDDFEDISRGAIVKVQQIINDHILLVTKQS